MAQQDPNAVFRMVTSLQAAQGKKRSNKSTFSCKKTTFPVAGSDNISVDSWRFQDWDYKRDDLPTYARGLFTTVDKAGKHEIAVRGYDKFFNVDEVNSTKWRNIENNTRGPYELSVKENGCIIFISGLEDGTLLVCSKHSTGVRQDISVSHAEVGRRWVQKHVASVGRTEKDLAEELRLMNATAVGELCDDTFEEHVLAYPEEASGIYLHGINLNLPEFATYRSPQVHAFADAWGFKRAEFLVKHSLAEVKTFLEECAETGSWDGRDTEGFVIRCQMRENSSGPYQDWFFKYKFEEPYLMYRQWREATKAMIAGKPPRFKKHIKITEEYLRYARKQFVKDSKLTKLYNQNHGIIALRDGFLQERGLKGSEIIAMETAEENVPASIDKDVVLVPIASIGCGKTTVALALVKLFGWSHVQNDNIEGRNNRPKRFAQGLIQGLQASSVVIADRNNHQKRERNQIFNDVRTIIPEAHFIALHYVHEPKNMLLDEIRQVTQQRVLDRGDNHQTIQAGTKSESEIIGIMEGFLQRFEGVNVNYEPDSNFDDVIDLDVTASSRENLETIVNMIYASRPGLMGRPKPTESELDTAIAEAMDDYKVDLKHDLSFNTKKKDHQQSKATASIPTKPTETPDQLVKKVEYFGISVQVSEIKSTLSSLFANSPPERSRFYNHLIHSRRLQPAFHTTLVHRATTKDHPEIWKLYVELFKDTIKQDEVSGPAPILGSARVRLERLVWDSRIMAIVTRIMPRDHETNPLVPDNVEVWPCANPIPHITIGTASPDVKPKESNDLLKKWLEVGASPETGIWEAEIPGVKVIDGKVNTMMRR
ncbi:hypothetical protein FQN57_000435 [Myotisia sp. PD_48]|nr:hypothetical protein FQN57_000435 [Myotisia sp. PD_48]